MGVLQAILYSVTKKNSGSIALLHNCNASYTANLGVSNLT